MCGFAVLSHPIRGFATLSDLICDFAILETWMRYAVLVVFICGFAVSKHIICDLGFLIILLHTEEPVMTHKTKSHTRVKTALF